MRQNALYLLLNSNNIQISDLYWIENCVAWTSILVSITRHDRVWVVVVSLLHPSRRSCPLRRRPHKSRIIPRPLCSIPRPSPALRAGSGPPLHPPPALPVERSQFRPEDSSHQFLLGGLRNIRARSAPTTKLMLNLRRGDKFRPGPGRIRRGLITEGIFDFTRTRIQFPQRGNEDSVMSGTRCCSPI